jgi:hypothetical protein
MFYFVIKSRLREGKLQSKLKSTYLSKTSQEAKTPRACIIKLFIAVINYVM